MEKKQYYKGMPVSNYESYYTESGVYVEEFDTEDGKHWIGGALPEDYPDDVREEAIELGIIDKDGNVIPMQ
ncbi:MAG: hypothetical protein K6C08_06265 [Oscillospiraceae bacterium]|nr:hypothetical protein [Oscillospiraceae bacterium]